MIFSILLTLFFGIVFSCMIGVPMYAIHSAFTKKDVKSHLWLTLLIAGIVGFGFAITGHGSLSELYVGADLLTIITSQIELFLTVMYFPFFVGWLILAFYAGLELILLKAKKVSKRSSQSAK